MIFNPSFPYRFTHMLLASALTCAFLLVGPVGLAAAARRRRSARRPRVLRVGLTLAALLIPLQIVVGDLHGLNTLQHQPAKIAAMEGVWQTERGAPLLLFAWPDDESAHATASRSQVPKLASLILTHELDGEIKGLNEFRDRHPPAAPLFFAFRIDGRHGRADARDELARLVAVPARALAAGAPAARAALGASPRMTFSGWVATVAGWYVTEIGRQPFIVYGLIRTADVVSTVSRRR